MGMEKRQQVLCSRSGSITSSFGAKMSQTSCEIDLDCSSCVTALITKAK
jgi:hypothetical protein